MKKILLILLAICFLTGCEEKTNEKPKEDKDIYAIIDEKFTENNINFSRGAKLNEASYYAKEGYQYVIDDATCIVDIYYFGEDSDIYKDAYERQAIRSMDFDNQYLVATVNAGVGAIIWNGCNSEEQIQSILESL